MLEDRTLAGKAAAPRADRTWVGGWLVSPSWDVLWILNGIPLALVFLLGTAWIRAPCCRTPPSC